MGLPRGWFLFLAIIAACVGFALHDPSPPPSPLLHAAFRGDLELVQGLLPLRAGETDPSFLAHVREQANARDHWNNTAMHWAAKGGKARSVDIAKHLLAAGTDSLAKNNAGSTALHWACSVADASVSTALIRLFLAQKWASVNAVNAAGETPLHWAVDWLRPHAVELLLQMGADPKLIDQEGNSPLHKIKADCHDKEDCTAIVTMLVKAGSDIMLKNNFQRTPLQYFNQDREQQSQKALKEAEMARQREQQRKEDDGETAATTTATGATPDSKLPPSPQRPLRMTDDQIDKIKEQFEEFKKNMTEGGREEEQTPQ